MVTLKRLIYKWIDKRFLGGCSSYNSLDVRKSCRSKLQARNVFEAHKIPHAKGTTFLNPMTGVKFARMHGFPLVVKPNVSGFSRGSHFPITNFKELLSAIFWAKMWWPVTVVEQYLEGKNYRIVVVKDGIMSVIRRYPPFVDGDGKSSISSLIDQENDLRKSMGLYPVIHAIPKDRKITAYLKKKNMTLHSIPDAGERVRLFSRISLAPGGVVEIIDKNSLPSENRELFEGILDHFGANILGIDAIFEKGIEHSYHQQKVILLEVNSRPYLKMHDVPRYGQPEDLKPFYDKLNNMAVGHQDIY